MAYKEILDTIVVPRPNGSDAFFEVAAFIKKWLQARGIPVEVHTFMLRPYMFEIIGGIILTLAVFFTYLAVRKKSLAALALPLLLGVVLFFEMVADVPIVSSACRVEAENIVVLFHPPEMEQEVIISAHYDSKTQISDHHSRNLLLNMGVFVTFLWIAVTIARWNSFRPGRKVSVSADVVQKIFLYLMMTFWGAVAFVFGAGFLAEPSPGAVDDASSVAVMMLLAEELDELHLQRTGVTLIFFAGEELNMQGSRVYVDDRFNTEPPVSVYNINLELLCQEGDYVFWREDGNFLHKKESCADLNNTIGKAVSEVTGNHLLPIPEGFTAFSDSGSFLLAGIPSTTISNSGCEKLGTRYLHTSLDCRDRIVEERIPEAVTILQRTLILMERAEYLFGIKGINLSCAIMPITSR